MRINKIALENFRNYEIQEIKLDQNINVFYGNNAQGKTNILEALYFCAFGRSFRTHKDAELINFEKEISKIEVEFEKNNREQSVEIILNKNEKKKIKLNDIKINKNSELLGNLNLVLFSPDDTVVLKESPASRRKFLDILISQLRPKYAHQLGIYNKILENRNTVIKSQKTETIDIWDEQLAASAEKIYEYRVEYINKLQKFVDKIAPSLTNEKEKLTIKYKSNFKSKEEYLKLLKQNLRNDLYRGYTTSGIHRDDFELFVNDKELNLYGSQGQHRTAILALKFAELEIIKDEINENPILLLDDITSELDLERIGQIFKKISDFQVLITCTDANILRNIESLTKEIKLYKINSGRVD
ncbi:MAG: DNA replication/repair protein RecF [Clostridia bacterium]|nr:DNA replication/repair protein RecF [Clostridia bacterium]